MLVLFDYVLLLREEISLFWLDKLTIATALFIANRYITLGYNLFLFITGFFGWSSDAVRALLSCPSYGCSHHFIDVRDAGPFIEYVAG